MISCRTALVSNKKFGTQIPFHQTTLATGPINKVFIDFINTIDVNKF